MLGYIAPFTEKNAETVALLKVQSWLDEGVNHEKILLYWNAGEGQKKCSKNKPGAKVKYDSCKYVKEGLLTLTAYANE